MLIPLSLIKKQCVVDEWYTDDDEYLKSLEQAAISIVENEIDQTINQVIAKNDGKLPVGLQQCILLLIICEIFLCNTFFLVECFL